MVKSYQNQLLEPEVATYPLVEDFMNRAFVTVHADHDIFHAMGVLLQNEVSGAPVIDAAGKLVGMLSEKDCLQVLTQEAYHHHPAGGPVSHYMTEKPVFVRSYSGLLNVAELFMNNSYRKVPVLDENEKLVGTVRRRDVLKVIHEHEQKKNQSFNK